MADLKRSANVHSIQFEENSRAEHKILPGFARARRPRSGATRPRTRYRDRAAPLLPGEKEADYATLANRIVDAAKPQDKIEELLTRDVIDLSWEILRLRRVKTGILKASMNIGVDEVLKALTHGPESLLLYRKELGKKWLAGDKNARKEVEAVLNKARLNIDEVTAKTVESKLHSFELLDRTSARAEARRNRRST